MVGALALFLLSGCATKPVDMQAPASDPFEKVNRVVYRFNDRVDRYALKPVAQGYQRYVPSLVRRGVTNFFGNLSDIATMPNDFLQGKFKQGASDTARVLVNTAFGFAGVIDIATPMGWPKHREDLGQTFAHYGIAEGPYIMLPFLGPATLRSTVGRVGDGRITDPLDWTKVDSRSQNQLRVLSIVDLRANLLNSSAVFNSAALDPYVLLRESYVKRRRVMAVDGAGGNPFARRPADATGQPSNGAAATDAVTDEIDQLDAIDELDEIDLLDAEDDDLFLDRP